MPEWIHNRAEHLLAKNPSMTKSQAFAIATQQSHKLGKSPKGYGTKKGKREARMKYDQPRKSYVRSANPGDLESPKMAALDEGRLVEYLAMSDELQKEALSMPFKGMTYMGKRLAAGTALGAAGGAAAGAVGAGEGNRLKGALGGALGGAALGAGAGYAAPRMAAHMRGGATLGQAAKNVGQEAVSGASAGLRSAGRKVTDPVLNPIRRARTNRAMAQAKKIDPEVAGAETVETFMKQMPAQTKQQVQAAISPQMAAMGMTPEAAAQLMAMGRGSGETALGAITRQASKARGSSLTPLPAFTPTTGTQFMAPAIAKAASVGGAEAASMRQTIKKDLSKAPSPARKAMRSIRRYMDYRKKKKQASAGDSPYMLDKLHVEPKVRRFQAEAPNPRHRVKLGAQTTGVYGMPTTSTNQPGFNPAKQLAKSQQIGVPKMKPTTVKPLGAKLSFAMSQFASGTTGGGRMSYWNLGPSSPFPAAGTKTAGPPGQKKKKGCGYSKMASMGDELAKLNAVTSPNSQLTKTQKIGAPKATAPPGPSIQQISKPVGFGRAQPGATKSGAI